MKHASKQPPEPISRRQALRRLSGAVVAAYVVPEFVFLSAAKAEQTGSGATPPSAPSAPSPSSPLEPPPDTTDSSTDEPDSGSADLPAESPGDTCNVSRPSGAGSISISRSDLSRSREAIDAGYARPLDQIWGEFISQYDGRIIGVEFTGRRRKPRYRFRAISRSGRLETVTISAKTGKILRIVGC